MKYIHINEWIRNALNENGLDKVIVKDAYEEACRYFNRTLTRKTFNDSVNRMYKEAEDKLLTGELTRNDISFNDITLEGSKLAKKNQTLRDTNRRANAVWRANVRDEITLETMGETIIESLKSYDFAKLQVTHKYKDSDEPKGIIHISDIHFNERTDECDFYISSKRIQKIAEESKRIFSAYGIKKICIVFTGDLLNSDRRLEERHARIYSRTKAALVGFHILRQFILDLNKVFHIEVHSVVGNESRVQDDHIRSDFELTDNYDYLITMLLAESFKDFKNVDFVNIQLHECTLDVNENKFLAMHGESQGTNLETFIQKRMGKYGYDGIRIDYVLLGHKHGCRISDVYARSASVVGNNVYSDRELNLIGAPSQNIFIVKGKHDIYGMRIDLRNISNLNGYDVIDDLVTYNTKSVKKIRKVHR